MHLSFPFSRHLLHDIVNIHSRRQLKELYVFLFLFSFAASMIFIFEPIFFYQQGFSLSKISLYYALHYSLYVVLMPFGAMFADRFGVERSLAFSTPIAVVYFLALARLPATPDIFWLALIILTFHKIFYWPALHATFAAAGDVKNLGTEISWAHGITFISRVLGPMLGGIIALTYGFPALFTLAAVAALLAGLPLLRTAEQYKVSNLSYGSVFKLLIQSRHRRMAIAMFGWIENLIHLVFWPILMFIILENVRSVGIVVAITTALATLWGFVIGELSDRYSDRKVLRISTFFVSVGHLLRTLTISPFQLVATDAYGRIANFSVEIPFLSHLHQEARKVNVIQYTAAFEMSLAIAKALAAWGLALMFLYVAVPVGLSLTFIIAALFALLLLVL